jgi:hypothetical protein
MMERRFSAGSGSGCDDYSGLTKIVILGQIPGFLLEANRMADLLRRDDL